MFLSDLNGAGYAVVHCPVCDVRQAAVLYADMSNYVDMCINILCKISMPINYKAKVASVMCGIHICSFYLCNINYNICRNNFKFLRHASVACSHLCEVLWHYGVYFILPAIYYFPIYVNRKYYTIYHRNLKLCTLME